MLAVSAHSRWASIISPCWLLPPVSNHVTNNETKPRKARERWSSRTRCMFRNIHVTAWASEGFMDITYWMMDSYIHTIIDTQRSTNTIHFAHNILICFGYLFLTIGRHGTWDYGGKRGGSTRDIGEKGIITLISFPAHHSMLSPCYRSNKCLNVWTLQLNHTLVHVVVWSGPIMLEKWVLIDNL